MNKRDNVHAKAIQNNNPLLRQNYRELRNKATCVTKERKNADFSDMNVLCRNDLKWIWSEIELYLMETDIPALLVTSLQMHFVNIGNKMNSKFQDLGEFPAKSSDTELWYFLWSTPKWTVE